MTNFFRLFSSFLGFFFFGGGECFSFVRNYEKTKVTVIAGQNLAGINKRLMYFFTSRECISLFWGRRKSDKMKIIVIWQLQNGIPKRHISVTIWRWMTLFLSFICIFQICVQFVVRLLCGVGLSISTPVCWHLTLQTDRPKSVRNLV